MIEAAVGLPGNGKSVFAVRRLLEWRAQGKRCFANFSSADGLWERVVWEDITRLSNAGVILDEGHMWFPARGFKNTTQEELAVFQQHRKAGLDMLWIAQDENRIDIALRELTAYLHYFRMIGAGNFKWVIQMTYEGTGKRMIKRRIWPAWPYFGRYWTEERVLLRDERTDDPIVGVLPNFCRYEDEFGHVRIVKRDEDDYGPITNRLLNYGSAQAYYRSPFSRRFCPY